MTAVALTVVIMILGTVVCALVVDHRLSRSPVDQPPPIDWDRFISDLERWAAAQRAPDRSQREDPRRPGT